jgi:hypothetical protein
VHTPERSSKSRRWVVARLKTFRGNRSRGKPDGTSGLPLHDLRGKVEEFGLQEHRLAFQARVDAH